MNDKPPDPAVLAVNAGRRFGKTSFAFEEVMYRLRAGETVALLSERGLQILEEDFGCKFDREKLERVFNGGES